MNPKIIAVAAAVLLFTTNAADAQEFAPYEGKKAFSEGDGGTKKVVDGVEFWADGAPPKKFKLLGYVTDRRHKTGIFGAIAMSSLESDVAKVAKENGGDAVILISSEAETVGAVGNSFGSWSGSANTIGGTTYDRASGWSAAFAAPVKKNNSKYAVVKYVPLDAPTADTEPKTAKPGPVVEEAGPDSPQRETAKTAPAE